MRLEKRAKMMKDKSMQARKGPSNPRGRQPKRMGSGPMPGKAPLSSLKGPDKGMG